LPKYKKCVCNYKTHFVLRIGSNPFCGPTQLSTSHRVPTQTNPSTDAMTLISCRQIVEWLLERKRFIKKVFQRWFCHTFFDCPLAVANWRLLGRGQWIDRNGLLGPKLRKKAALHHPCPHHHHHHRHHQRSDYLWCIRDLWFFELGRKYSSRAKASNEKKRVFSAVYPVNTYGQWLTLRKCQGIWLAFMIGRLRY